MKNFKKILALVVAMVMIIGTMSMSAFADQGAATADGSISISGLDEGDTVALYQVIGWADGTGWELVNDFAVPQFEGKLGTANQAISIDTGVVDTINGQITNSTPQVSGGSLENGTYSATVDPGMYIAIVTAAEPGVVYNPIIVSSDFVADGNTIDASHSSIPSSNGGAAVAKKSKVTLSKEASNTENHDTYDGYEYDDETVKVGDTLTFTVDTVIPPFAGYKDPSFVLTDEMTDGLEYISTGGTNGITMVTPSDAVYTVTPSDHGYVITFDSEYLKTIATNTNVQFTYQAKVTTDAINSVNHENNTITLEFSNNPNDSSSKTKLRDRTNHYTFTLDGNLLGQDNYSASEVVKVGVSADGSEILETIELANGSSIGALQNAHFALYAVTDEEFTAAQGENGTFDTTGKTAFVNGNGESYDDFTSGADGRFTIKGLDGGKYVLVEKSAPAGYIKRQTPVTIEIIPTVNTNVTYEEDADGVTVEVTTKELVSYQVLVDGVETANYTITNSADAVKTSSDAADHAGEGDKGKIKNTKGVELPSTGGIGTTLFYVIGAILVLGAGVLLVTRRRMNAN